MIHNVLYLLLSSLRKSERKNITKRLTKLSLLLLCQHAKQNDVFEYSKKVTWISFDFLILSESLVRAC